MPHCKLELIPEVPSVGNARAENHGPNKWFYLFIEYVYCLQHCELPCLQSHPISTAIIDKCHGIVPKTELDSFVLLPLKVEEYCKDRRSGLHLDFMMRPCEGPTLRNCLHCKCFRYQWIMLMINSQLHQCLLSFPSFTAGGKAMHWHSWLTQAILLPRAEQSNNHSSQGSVKSLWPRDRKFYYFPPWY